MKKLIQYRQGEVLLTRVKNVPSGFISTVVKNPVMSIGETGNAHVLECGVEVEWLHQAIEDMNTIARQGAPARKGELYIRIPEQAEIVHRATKEPHRNMVIPAGVYRVTNDTEVTPWGQVRNVLD